MSRYRSYPRIVGETGGKDFIVAHASADPQALAVAIVRGGFEYQGQKCSAVSRVYVPRSIWPDVRDRAVAMLREIKMGDVADFRNFMGAVIDKRAFEKIGEYLAEATARAPAIVHGGNAHGEKGWFIEPTLVETDDPAYRLLCEEIFGPVVTAHVYDDARWAETLQAVDSTSPYALTGAVFAQDRAGRARGLIGAPERRRQLLHQRQADRRRRRPAAVRRSARVRHQRQGGLQAQPRTLGQRAHDQGDLLARRATTRTRSWPRSDRDVLRTLAVIVLLLTLLILLGMSFLRVNNLEYDVSVLKEQVARLQAGGPAPPPVLAPIASLPPSPSAAPLATMAARPAPSSPPAASPAASPAAPPQSAEGLTAGFLDDGAEVQAIALPAGMRPARARVTILAIEGDGTGERALPEPIAFVLQAGTPHAVTGICQGPETAAWVFALEGTSVRITSRDCEYPIRGLRPRLRITAAP